MSRLISATAGLDRFIAATSEGGFPPETSNARVAYWPHDNALPLDVARKAAEVCGLEVKVTTYDEGEFVTMASLANRGCGCSKEDKLAVIQLTCIPKWLA